MELNETFSLSAGIVETVHKKWETGILKKNVFALNFNKSNHNLEPNRISISENIRDILSQLSPFRPFMISTRLPASSSQKILCLEENDFFLVENYITLEHDLQFILTKKRQGIQIRTLKNIDIPELENIAARSLRNSRFHKDRYINNDIADRTRSEWIKNACKGRAKKVFVAQMDSDIAGFLACNEKCRNHELIGILDLIAVDSSYRRKCIGSHLSIDFLNFCKKQNYISAQVGTQSQNTAALKMYTSLGFKLSNSYLSYHAHID